MAQSKVNDTDEADFDEDIEEIDLDEDEIEMEEVGMGVENHLLDLRYPATKAQIVDFAKGNDAPADVVDKLESLPDREYADWEDLSNEMELLA